MAERTRKVELPADRPGYRPMPLALMDQMSVCERCWSVVSRFHQEPHDAWHASGERQQLN